MGSENEETLATHPDPSKERTRDKERSRQVTDVTDPIQSATYTMKLRANHILCVGVLVLLGLVLLSTQVRAENELEPEPTRGLQGYHDHYYGYYHRPCHWKKHWKHWKHWKSGRDGRRLLSEQMKADDSDQVFQMRPDSDLLSEQMKVDDSDQVFQMRADSDLLSEQMKDDDSDQVFQMRADSELEPEPTRALLGYHDPCRDCGHHCPYHCNQPHPVRPDRPKRKCGYKNKGGKSKGGWRGRRD